MAFIFVKVVSKTTPNACYLTSVHTRSFMLAIYKQPGKPTSDHTVPVIWNEFLLKKVNLSWAVVVEAFNPSTREAEASESL